MGGDEGAQRMCERGFERGRLNSSRFLWRGLGTGCGGCRSLVFRVELSGRGQPTKSSVEFLEVEETELTIEHITKNQMTTFMISASFSASSRS
jgi:hypothetical protein